MPNSLQFIPYEPPRGFSQAVSVPPATRLVLVSGQVPMPLGGGAPCSGGWAEQTRTAMENVAHALRASDATWSDVVMLRFFVIDTSSMDTICRVRDEFVNVANPPASTLVHVAGFGAAGMLIEVEAVAAVPGDR